jgi:hypothetical protein
MMPLSEKTFGNRYNNRQWKGIFGKGDKPKNRAGSPGSRPGLLHARVSAGLAVMPFWFSA